MERQHERYTTITSANNGWVCQKSKRQNFLSPLIPEAVKEKEKEEQEEEGDPQSAVT